MNTSISIACPFCYQVTCVEIGEAFDGLELIEDCQNCCNPITIILRVQNGEIVDYKASKD